jgi:hypothetical protein
MGIESPYFENDCHKSQNLQKSPFSPNNLFLKTEKTKWLILLLLNFASIIKPFFKALTTRSKR